MVQEKNEAVLARFDEIEERLDRLIQKIEFLESENQRLKKEIDVLEKDNKEKDNAQTAYEQEKAQVRAKIDALLEKVDQATQLA